MTVAIVPKFSRAQIERYMNECAARMKEKIISRFQRVGETFVTNARNKGDYKDQSGNLRSSVGYIVIVDGVQLFEGFPGGKPEGVAQARKTAEEAKQKFPRGIALIVVAGMEYAAAVESKNKDVLTASGKIAETELRNAMKKIGKR